MPNWSRCDDAGPSYHYPRNCGRGGYHHFWAHSIVTKDLAMRRVAQNSAANGGSNFVLRLLIWPPATSGRSPNSVVHWKKRYFRQKGTLWLQWLPSQTRFQKRFFWNASNNSGTAGRSVCSPKGTTLRMINFSTLQVCRFFFPAQGGYLI